MLPLEEIVMILLTGSIGATPLAFIISSNKKNVKTSFSPDFQSKSEAIVMIGIVHIVTGVLLKYSSSMINYIITTVNTNVSKEILHSLLFEYLQISISSQILTSIGLAMAILWINLHLAVNEFNIDSLGESNLNIIFWVATLSLIFL